MAFKKGEVQTHLVGDKNLFWKGKNVSYSGLHKWVGRWLGKPSTCSKCGKKGTGKQMQWANKSGEYKRELSDWVRLCAGCHGQFDRKAHCKNGHEFGENNFYMAVDRKGYPFRKCKQCTKNEYERQKQSGQRARYYATQLDRRRRERV